MPLIPSLCVHHSWPQADHLGVTFSVQHMAKVSSISPTISGTSGGDRITLTGESFTVNSSSAKVFLSGTPCNVVLASMNQIVCELAAKADNPKGFTQTGQVVYPGMLPLSCTMCLCLEEHRHLFFELRALVFA